MAADADLSDEHVPLPTVSKLKSVSFAQFDEGPWRECERSIPALKAAMLMDIKPHSDVIVRNLLATRDFAGNLFHVGE
jgi:hypothetical protein